MALSSYIADGLHGIFPFACVQTTVAIFVEEFGKDEVSIANDAITVKVIADICDKLLPAILLQVCQSAIRISLFTFLPPSWNFYLFCVPSRISTPYSILDFFFE